MAGEAGGAANARTPTSRDTFALSADPLVALSLPYVSPPHIHCAGVLDQIEITGDDDKPLLLDSPSHIRTTPIVKLRITEGPW